MRLLQRATRGFLWLCTSLIASGLLFVGIDAVFPLPSMIRGLLLGAWLSAAVLVLAVGLWRGLRQRFNPHGLAREVECQLGVENNLLINAVEFAESSQAEDSPVLRERVVRLAEQRVRTVSALEVLPFHSVRRALGWGMLAFVLGLGAWWAAPGLFAAVIPRFTDPWGDHPPFTLVTFDIRVSPELVLHSRPAKVLATLGGPEEITQAEAVFLPSEGSPPESASVRVLMFREEDRTYAIEIERPVASQRFYIDTPRGRSPTQLLNVVEAPLFEDVSARYEYPAYTGWPAVEQRLDGRGLRGLAGTDAVITVRSNLPLEQGSIAFAPGPVTPSDLLSATVPLRPLPGDARSVQGRLRLESTGYFGIRLQAQSGGLNPELMTGPIVVAPDREPSVSILQPQPHVVVVEGWTVPVLIEALDDVGIAELRLSRSVNDWGVSSVDLPLVSNESGRARGEYQFDLATLGARAGDVITYYATAADNHPDPPHFADSATGIIQVISQDEYLQHARQQYQIDDLVAEFQAIQEQLDHLQQQREAALHELQALKETLAADPDNAELADDIEELQQKLEQLTEQAEQLADQFAQRSEQSELYEIEKPYTEGLRQLAEQMRQQSQASQAVAQALERLRRQGPSPENRQALEEALQSLHMQDAGLDLAAQEQREALQDDLELFQLADRLQTQAERLQSIIQQQRELATKLSEFQNREQLTPGEQRRTDQLAKQQELLEQELQQTARDLEQDADAAQDRLPMMSASARAIAQAIQEQQILEDQQQAAAGARNGSGREAFDKAAAAASKLEALAKSGQSLNSDGMAGEVSQGLDGPLSLSRDGAQQALQQLSQGRGLPGQPRPSDSDPSLPDGTGQSGQSSRSDNGNSPNARWRPGQTFPGSQARTPVLGPRMLVEAEPSQPGGQLEGNDRGTFLPGRAGGRLRTAEQLTPDARTGSSSAAGNLRGVPVPYRKEAEAYFRRLAEDEAQQ
ncbi:MAG: hypothetical protein ACK5Q5_08525 [Planctomycetaceae bacterium]